MPTIIRYAGFGLVLLFLAACVPVTPTSPPTGPRLTYEVGGCREVVPPEQYREWEGVDIQVEDGQVHIVDHLPYVCCADIEVVMRVEGQTIKLVERNVGDVCRCMCPYRVEMHVTDLAAGTYIVQVWGVEDERTGPTELRGEKTIIINR